MASTQQVIERTVLEATKVIENQVDAEIERLDHMDDDELDKIRQTRLKQMKQAANQKEEWLKNGHGKYEEIGEEKDFFDACKKSNKLVCHFYRDSTFRCKIVDKHLNLLAPKHVETRFVKLSVDRAHFLCERLKIWMLPTLAIIVDNKTTDYIKGFDDLGGVDDFKTEMLEWRLACANAINYSGNILEPPGTSKTKPSLLSRPDKTIRSGHISSDDDD